MKNILSFLIAVIISFQVNAQTNIIDIINENGTATVSTCQDSFFIDNENGNLSNADIIFTICSNDELISTIDFTSFNIPSLIDFTIYDGDDTTAVEIPYDGSLSLVSASDTNPTGCLTIAISSNFIPSSISAEIAIDAGCRDQCQNLETLLVSLEANDICSDEDANLITFPQNEGITFNADANASNGTPNDELIFTWEIENPNNETTTLTGQNPSQAFNVPGLYQGILTVTDEFFCESDPVGFNFIIGINELSVSVQGDQFTLQQLIEDILVGSGDCAIVENVNSPVSSPNGTSIGYFNRGCSDFPFEDGIIIGSSGIGEIVGNTENENGWSEPSESQNGPNEQLLSLVGGNLENNINDATVIEFDFSTPENEVSFNFIYASMEYAANYPCSYADPIAFIVSGPGINNTNAYWPDGNPANEEVIDFGGLNVATVIPDGGSTPIPAIATNIHPGSPNFSCVPGSNGHFFYPEFFNQINPSYHNIYGETNILTASFNVIPNEIYNIKLMVADWADNISNSYVFIEGGSFDINADCSPPCIDTFPSLVNVQPSTFNVNTGNYEVSDFIPVTFEIVHDNIDNENFTYEWDFGDGVTETTNEPFIQHAFGAVLEYNVQVTVIDQFDCETLNSNLANVEVISRTSDSCAEAQALCAGGDLYFFPNINNQTPGGASSAEPGPEYNCLLTQPYPAWFYMEVEESGDFEFLLKQNTSADFNGTGLDVDFIAWGPFDTPYDNCNNLTSANEVDCSYSVSATETMIIPNTTAGEFYFVLITNFNASPGFISFEQTNIDNPNAGVSGCSILGESEDANLCVGEDYTIFPTIPGELVGDQVQYTWELFNETNGEYEVIPNENESYLTVSAPGGTYRLTAENPISGAVVNGIVNINFFNQPTIQTDIVDIIFCVEDLEDAEINLNDVDLGITGIPNTQLSVAFYPTLIDAENNTNIIQNPEAYQPANDSETIFIKAENILSETCSSINSFEIINNYPVITIPNEPLLDCDEDTTGTATFDLTSFEDTLFENANPADFTIAYYETQEDADNQVNQIANPVEYFANAPLTNIFIALDNGECSTTVNATLSIDPNNESCEGIGVEDFSQQIQLYPNPVSSILHIDYSAVTPIESLKIFNMNGQLVSKQNYNRSQNHIQFDFSEYAAGIYFVEISNGKQIDIEKVIKK